jgi:hypothetical protein
LPEGASPGFQSTFPVILRITRGQDDDRCASPLIMIGSGFIREKIVLFPSIGMSVDLPQRGQRHLGDAIGNFLY